MPLLETKGAGSAQGFGLSLGGEEAVYIEDVFSTWLIKPTTVNTTYSVTNGIDVSGEGGMVWMKSRDAAGNNLLYDTARGASAGANNALISNSTAAQQTANFDYITGLSNGFTVNFASGGGQLTNDGINYVSWTFRKQPKFFDIVTYTGTGSNRTIAHNLGSVPGCIMVKKTSGAASDWNVYHRSIGNTFRVLLNSTSAAVDVSDVVWNATTPTATVFSLGTNSGVNSSGDTYVAYLFAHDAGGFGLDGTDNVISCGSFTTSGGGAATVTLGYEPQWVLIKSSSADDGYGWLLLDTMRGFTVPGTAGDFYLRANSSAAESGSSEFGGPTATGFDITSLQSSTTYIYIAIRRGPMKVPTSGTEVFEPKTRSGTGGATTVTSTIRPDTVLQNWRSGGLGSANHFMYDRLRGVAKALFTDTADAESTQTPTGINAFNNLSYGIAGAGSMNNGSALYVDYLFTRAPGFFDEVCYTGTGSATTFSHNLGAVPELMIVKLRSAGGENWTVWNTTIAGLNAANFLWLNSTSNTITNSGRFNSTAPTSSVFTVGSDTSTNGSGSTYVAYLFATLAGVSKVGSYTGTGTTQTINCGFTAGARFVMIKRTDSTGDWYVWDSARGIVAGNDPYLLLNEAAAEVTSTDYIDTASTGFEISSTAPAAINASGGTFIFLAIA